MVELMACWCSISVPDGGGELPRSEESSFIVLQPEGWVIVGFNAVDLTARSTELGVCNATARLQQQKLFSCQRGGHACISTAVL